MHSTKRLWTPEARARKHLKLGPNTILAIMRHGCSILTATISRSFIRAKLDKSKAKEAIQTKEIDELKKDSNITASDSQMRAYQLDRPGSLDGLVLAERN